MTTNDILDYLNFSGRTILLNQEIILKIFNNKPLTEGELILAQVFCPEMRTEPRTTLTEALYRAEQFFKKHNLIGIITNGKRGVEILVRKN